MRSLKPLTESAFKKSDPHLFLEDYQSDCIDLVLTAPSNYTLDGTERFYEDTSYKWESFEDYMNYMESVFVEVYRMLKNFHYCAVVVGDQTTYVDTFGFKEIKTFKTPKRVHKNDEPKKPVHPKPKR